MTVSTERCLQVCRAAIASLLLTAPAVAGEVEEMLAMPANPDRVPTVTRMPEYPKIARRDRIEGQVQVCFEVTRDGRTRRIAVRKSTNRVFEKPAMRAVRASRYEPLPPDAKLTGIKTCRTFRFSLEPVVAETENN